MNKEFVTQRVAELLRLNGFDGNTNHYYADGDVGLLRSLSTINWNDVVGYYSAPIVQSARDWLEEKYGFFIEIGRSIDLNGKYHYSYLILDKTCKYIYNQKDKNNDFPSSYDAANAALELCLENFIR